MPNGIKTGGRKKGVPNKITGDIREMIKQSLVLAGGIDYLVEQSKKNPQAYMGLIGKVMPKELEANITGTLTVVDEFAGQ